MGGLQSCLQGGPDSAEAAQGGPQKVASTKGHHLTISSKAEEEQTPPVPWASQCSRDWEDHALQEHTPRPHENRQQEHQVQQQHKPVPAAAAAPCPTARTSSSASKQSCSSTPRSKPAKLSSREPEALLGFAPEPGKPHNAHHSGPPRPACEDSRLVVATYLAQLLDNVPHEPLDSLLQLACSMFNVSAALFVLCGDRCIRALRAHCPDGDFEGDPSWKNSFCGWTLSSQQPAVLVVNDTLQDARFYDNVHVQSGAIRFYCGAPMVSSTGHRLGTLALVDAVPRTFDTSCLQALANIAELSVRELELQIAQQRLQMAQQQQQQQPRLSRALPDCSPQPAAAAGKAAAAAAAAAAAGKAAAQAEAAAVLQQGTGTGQGATNHHQQHQQQQPADAQLPRSTAEVDLLLPPWLQAKQSTADTAHAAAAAENASLLAGDAAPQGAPTSSFASQERQQPPVVQPQQQQQQQQPQSLYPMQLRTAETVCGAVLLVDSSRDGWPILHANTAGQQLLMQLRTSSSNSSSSNSQQQQVHLSTHQPGQAAANLPSSSSACGNMIRCSQQLRTIEPAAAAAASARVGEDTQPPASAHTSSSSSACSGSSCSSSASIDGLTIKNIIDPLQLVYMQSAVPCSSSSAMSQSMFLPNLPRSGVASGMPGASAAAAAAAAGWPLSFRQRVVLQAQGRQSFSMHNVKLTSSLGGVVVTLTFRCAGFSALEGAAPVCLPTSQPDASELSTALALQSLAVGRRSNTDNPSLSTAAASRCLYFVTVKPHKEAAAAARDEGAESAAAAAARAAGDRNSGYFGLPERLGTPRPSEGSSSNNNSSSSNSSSAEATGSSWGSSIKQQQPWIDSSSSNSSSRSACPPGSSSSSSHSDGRGGTKSLSSGCNISSQLLPILVPCAFPQFAEEDVVQEATAAATAASPISSSSGGSREWHLGLTRGAQLQLEDLHIVTSVDEGADTSPTAAAGGGSGRPLLRAGSDHPLLTSACNRAAANSSSSAAAGRRRATAMSCGSNIVSSSSSSNGHMLLGGGFCSQYARLVCSKLPGLVLGGQIAAGTHGKVFRADYNSMKAAVKVLDSSSGSWLPLQPPAEGGSLSLSGLISGKLRHTNLVSTLAWAVVEPRQQTAAAAAAAATAAGQQASKSTGGCGAAGAEGSGAAAATVGGGAAAPGAGGGVAGQTWLVQEYCDRGCLQDAVDCGWLRERRSCVSGAVDMLAVVATTAEVAAAMLLLHKSGIVHGDLSAFNVLLTSSDLVNGLCGRGFIAKVADFGLQKRFDMASLAGNPYRHIAHLAPEVLQHGECTKAADVYSFGVLLFMMATGSSAWAGLPHADIVEAVCTCKRQLAFPPESPPPLTLLARACMAYNPAERPCFADIVEILQPVSGSFLSG